MASRRGIVRESKAAIKTSGKRQATMRAKRKKRRQDRKEERGTPILLAERKLSTNNAQNPT